MLRNRPKWCILRVLDRRKAYYDLFAYNRSVLLITLSIIFIIFIPLFIFRTNTLPKRSVPISITFLLYFCGVISYKIIVFIGISFGFVDRFEVGSY